MKVYIASPLDKDKRKYAQAVKCYLKQDCGFDVFFPFDHTVPNAWELSNQEWAELVFFNDVNAIKDCDIVVALSYGRQSTAGTNFEIGYAYGLGKKVIVVEMTDNIMSLMVSNCSHATVKGLYGLFEYDFDLMPKVRTETEQM